MRGWLIVVPWLNVSAMALFPFILLRSSAMRKDEVLLNHERIHLRQQIELLVLPFYMFYLLNYLVNLARYRNHHQAYMGISFEREAYKMEVDLAYLNRRKFCNWLIFF
ncbi:hypothetical protein [Mucilaginibacter psychrotolerans]|uniref:DUF4157 domain-containing protein n=1 Tax=Mucilaginibacter psychrotolerans TaxID=1524096 RepID=A0A4Y8SMG4_9SPHI|nr:hypothetical protein [Mucilaginibacter psychrotolerans]TFF40249.1 hypothetical protein E2R66_03080 [Mucilaginibacter psychrotolerans]